MKKYKFWLFIGVPNEYKKVWYNQSAYAKKGETEYPIIFDENKRYIRCEEGLEVIMGYTSEGLPIWYEVVKIKYGGGSDYLYESDSTYCDLKLVRIGDVVKWKARIIAFATVLALGAIVIMAKQFFEYLTK